MYFPTIVLALASTVAASTQLDYFCPLAMDKSNFIQQAYCCEGFNPAPHTDKAYVGVNCQDMTNNVVKECPKGGTPKCCYAINTQIICTSETGALDD